MATEKYMVMWRAAGSGGCEIVDGEAAARALYADKPEAWFGEVLFSTAASDRDIHGITMEPPAWRCAPGFFVIGDWRDLDYIGGSFRVTRHPDGALALAALNEMVHTEFAPTETIYLEYARLVRVLEQRPADRPATSPPFDGAWALEKCLRDPASDAPRLEWAYQIGGERGELVEVQCALARGTGDTAALRAREAALLAANGAAWSEFTRAASGCTFARGFVDWVEVDAESFGRNATGFQRQAPLLERVRLTGPPREPLWDAAPMRPQAISVGEPRPDAVLVPLNLRPF